MRIGLMIVVVGCTRESPPTPTVAVGSGSAAKPVACDLAGNYRARFRSNNADGWWLRWKIAGGKAELTAKDVMDLVPQGPLALAIDGCKATITAHTDHSGDTKLVVTLDPATNAITGQLSRTIGGSDHEGPETVPVAGRRDVGPIGTRCLKPGVYELAVDTKSHWKRSEGHSHVGSCKDWSDVAHATVRIEPLGDELFVDEISGDAHEQSFARGIVKKTGECAIDLALEVQDFAFDGSLVFDGDTVTGRAKTAHYTFMEDGDAGENQWGCKTSDAVLQIKRIAD